MVGEGYGRRGTLGESNESSANELREREREGEWFVTCMSFQHKLNFRNMLLQFKKKVKTSMN